MSWVDKNRGWRGWGGGGDDYSGRESKRLSDKFFTVIIEMERHQITTPYEYFTLLQHYHANIKWTSCTAELRIFSILRLASFILVSFLKLNYKEINNKG